jgi:high-affinity iron transporter
MLINTVILWLRDLLPAFIAGVLLFNLTGDIQPKRSISVILVLGLALALLLFFNLEPLSKLFSGAGIELVSCIFYLVSYTSFLIFLCYAHRCWRMLSISVLLAVKLMTFIVYFSLYAQQATSMNILLLGWLLGAGISISFSVLFYLFVHFIKEKLSINAVVVLSVLFFSGQLSQVIPLLLQIDFYHDASIIWNTSWLIEDSSEYGHLFTSLVGYEATPSYSHLIIFVVAFMLPTFLFVYRQRLAVIFLNRRSDDHE